MKHDVISVMLIPSERGGIVVGKNGATLMKTQLDTQTSIVLEKIDGSVNTRITITGRDKRKVADAERRILENLSCTQKETELISSSAVVKLVEGWKAEESNNFHKLTQTFVEIAKLSGGSSNVIIRGWDKKSIVSAITILTKKAGKVNSDISKKQGNHTQGRVEAVVEVLTDALTSKSDTRKLAEIENDCSVAINRATGNTGKKGKRRKTTFNITANNKVDLNECVSKLAALLEPLTVTIKSSGRDSSAPNGKKKDKFVPIPLDESESNSSDTDSESLLAIENDRAELEVKKIKYPNCMNVLVLGETGVGKSTFINGLVNYLKYGSMDEALEGGVEILIKSHFTLTDDNFATRDIVTEVTIPDEQGAAVNEMHGQGQSATQDPKSYMFSWMDGSEVKAIRIIDTPGIGDTRGIDQDKKNFDKILSFIADFSELHAVCILIKPNTARLTLAFRFCIDELLVHLHKSASENIVFCFTNTRGTLYKPGDTLPTLREHLSKLEAHRGIHIPLNKSTLFSFDNESFRFLCACKEGFPFEKSDKANFSGSWDKSVEESRRLFARVTELPVHNVNDTLCLNNTRSVIITLARPLAEIARNQLINMRLIEDKMKEVEQHAEEGTNLRGNLYVDQIVIHAEELPYPQTVCTAASCVTHMRFNTNENSPMQTVYKTICHDHCYLTGVQVENCPNTILQGCWAMSGMNCRICNCLWSTHMHIRYKLNQSMQQVIDPTVEQSIKNKDDAITTIRLFLTKERQKVDQLKAESEKITAYCAEFAAFLKQNSILPYNDSYRQYIEHLIREEREKVAAGGPEALLREMEQYKAEYEQQVNLLDSSMNQTGVKARSVNEMNTMIKELQNLQHCGSVLSEIKKLEMMSVRQTQAHMCKKVNVDGLFSRIKKGAKKLMGYPK